MSYLQTGIAAWISKCEQGGAPVTIVAHETGEPLGHYSAEHGYVPEQ